MINEVPGRPCATFPPSDMNRGGTYSTHEQHPGLRHEIYTKCLINTEPPTLGREIMLYGWWAGSQENRGVPLQPPSLKPLLPSLVPPPEADSEPRGKTPI